MDGAQSIRSLARRCLAALVGGFALVAAGCGASATAPPPGVSISGPGLQTSMPPWQPQYANLAQRLKQIAIPPGGKEKFHIPALLHIYVEGLLSPLPAD